MSAHATPTPAHRRPLHRTLARVASLAVFATGILIAATPTPGPQPLDPVERHSQVASRSDERPISTTLIVHTGSDQVTYTTDAQSGTLGQALAGRGIVLGEHDQMAPAPETPLPVGTALDVTVLHAALTYEAEDSVQPYPTSSIDDPTLAAGTASVTQAGVDGHTRTLFEVWTLPDGTVTSRTATTAIVVNAPVEQVELRGTKVAAKTPVAAPVAAGTARAIGAQAVADRGWDTSQWACLDALWARESGWSTTAANPSGAYGIPQALPGSKMASAGADWATNPVTQITWGLSYIAGRYGTPCAAWQHSQDVGWY